ncbi:MAG: hypothetical protein BMS9Abin29_2315 [Gemmatimonadota bacterium]|nr:MAG: hypothetical protein BMS9Abin29_2315 [Gemmatimonadota bacterium]
MKRDTLHRVLADRDGERPFVLATRLDTGDQVLIRPDEDGADGVPGPVRDAALQALTADRSATVSIDEVDHFLQVFNPPVQVILVGAVHIAQPLCHMARVAGFRVTLVDPRKAFSTEERFPGVHLVRAWPGEAFGSLRLDRRTAVVTLSHDPKFDDPALELALRSPVFYIGALGSRRTHAKRCGRLEAAGFAQADLSRIHGPVGLDIGARTPGEIAVSVMAELVDCLRAGDR